MRRKKTPTKQKNFWRTNNQIRAESLRVLSDKGEQIGVLTLSEALAKAREAGSDLIEIAPKAVPPVAKIIDFGKFKYQEEKKARKQKRGVKTVGLKEVRFSPFIGEADYQTRKARIDEFLKEGHKVRLVVKFKGRQMGSKSFGYDLIKKITVDFDGRIVLDMPPKFIGRHLAAVISPTNKSKSKEENPKELNTEVAKVKSDDQNSDIK